ncbi:MAG: response regulator transcription factor [Patescibacteria group bacterium]
MRILIVEDNAHIRSLIKLGLEAESFTVDAASDGEKGSFTARTNEYDLIILDLDLPKKRGNTICKEIRRAGKTTPILILSVESELPTKIDLFNMGADDYLTKPFSFEELVARIRSLLRRPHTMLAQTLIAGDITLDTNTQDVSRGKKSIYLTRKEFLLLEYLMRHKGVVVSRGRLLEHVWDLDGDPFSNSIETHICNIRKKISSPRKPELIENVPGRGYKMAVV